MTDMVTINGVRYRREDAERRKLIPKLNRPHQPADKPKRVVIVCDRDNPEHKKSRPRVATFEKIPGWDAAPEGAWKWVAKSPRDRWEDVHVELNGDEENTWAADTAQHSQERGRMRRSLVDGGHDPARVEALLALWDMNHPAPVNEAPVDVRNRYRLECSSCRQPVVMRQASLFAALDNCAARGAYETGLVQLVAIV